MVVTLLVVVVQEILVELLVVEVQVELIQK